MFGQEHGDFGLYRVGVLGLIDEQVREAAAEVVAHFEVAAQQLVSPSQQVVKLGPPLGPTLPGVFEGELPQSIEDWRENGAPRLCDFPGSGVVQFLEQTFQGRTGVVAGLGVNAPIPLPASTVFQG